jgi:GT2 family glycosyltransferase
VVFTWYDALALFNPAATAATGCWDETFMWYVSDVDYYNRLLWSGWGHHHLPDACAIHHGSQTIRGLSEAAREAVDRDHNWSVRHYRHKWGCAWDEGNGGRAWSVPYNGGA